MNHDEFDSQLWSRLEELKPVPPRDPKVALLGRANFLNQALKIESRVSARGFLRLNQWIPKAKEKFAMNLLISIAVIAGLLFGGGATVNAAQDDLPGQPLYAVKTASEDVSLQFQNNPEAKVARLMDLAQIRIQEMTQLIEEGQTPPDQVQLRLEQHIQQALQVCSNLDDATLDQTLLQLRDRLQQRDRDMEQLQIHAAQDAQPILERTRTMLHQRLQLVNDGLLNHEMFRNTVRNGFQYGQEEELTPPAQNRNGQQNGQPTSAPGNSNTDPGGANTDPGDPNTDPGGTNTNPGSPNPNVTPAPNKDGNGNGSGGDDSGGNGSGGNGSGGDGSGGNGSGGNGP